MKFSEYFTECEAIEAFGVHSQVVVAIEELAELQKELTKYLRCEENADHIAEEMADVQVMMDQLEIIFKNTDTIDSWKKKKLERLSERLHNTTATEAEDIEQHREEVN